MSTPKKGPASPVSALEKEHPDNEHYFPEDERSPMDMEDDHSYTDFDLSAEIDAKLGTAADESSADAQATGSDTPPPPLDAPPLPADGYFPEDERSPMDMEDDHSYTDFDLSAEIDATTAKPRTPSADSSAAPVCRTPEADDAACFLEDDRSPLEWEDDHSYTDFDVNREVDDKLGPEEQTAAPEREPGPTAPPAEDTPPVDAATRAAAARNTEALHVDDDSCCPEEPEDFDDGDDDDDSGLRMPATSGAGSATPAVPPVKTDAASEDAAGENVPAPAAPSSPATMPPDEDDDEDEDDDDDEDDRPMSLRDHLNELRKRIFRAFLWVLAGFFLCYPFAEHIFALLFAPLTAVMPANSNLIYTSPPEAFFTFMKVAFVAGIFVTSPLIFYQVWAFIAPGLYKEEKLYVLPVAMCSAVFFVTGGAFCYFVVFPLAFEFFMSYNQGIIQAMPALSETLSFVLQLLLAFGVVFELPLFAFFLARLGIVTADMMRRFRRYAILGNVIIAAILTPPDVMSQLLMAGPLLLLYEASIFIAAAFGKKKKAPEEEAEDSEEEEKKDAAL